MILINLKAACASNIGIVRSSNQDAIMVHVKKKKKHMMALGAVCDGIGGLEHGEIASSLIIKRLEDWFDLVCKRMNWWNMEKEILFAHLKDEVEVAGEKLWDYICKNQVMTGTTLSLILIIDDQYFAIQMGDSRIYRFHQYLEQITDDQVIAVNVDGRLKKKLTNYMGKKNLPDFLTYQGYVLPDELFLFCSDGFYHHVLANDLNFLLDKSMKKEKMKEALEKIINLMIQRGERDNISVGIIQCHQSKADIHKKFKIFGKRER